MPGSICTYIVQQLFRIGGKSTNVFLIFLETATVYEFRIISWLLRLPWGTTLLSLKPGLGRCDHSGHLLTRVFCIVSHIDAVIARGLTWGHSLPQLTREGSLFVHFCQWSYIILAIFLSVRRNRCWLIYNRPSSLLPWTVSIRRAKFQHFCGTHRQGTERINWGDFFMAARVFPRAGYTGRVVLRSTRVDVLTVFCLNHWSELTLLFEFKILIQFATSDLIKNEKSSL